MTAKVPNRIAAEDISGLVTWSPPEVGSRQTVRAAKDSAEQQRNAKEKAPSSRCHRDSEIIEDVTEGDVSYSPMTAQELQAITEAAEKEGFEKGFQEGFSKGEADGRRIAQDKATSEAREQLGLQVSHLLQVAEVLAEPIGEQQQALEKMLLEFVVGLTRQVVEREMQLDSAQVLQAVQVAITALPSGAANIKILVNPDDLALIETYAEEHQKDWSLRGDASLMAGGCRIETRESLVDYSMEHRLDELLEQFRNKQLAAETGAGSGAVIDHSAGGLDAANAAGAGNSGEGNL